MIGRKSYNLFLFYTNQNIYIQRIFCNLKLMVTEVDYLAEIKAAKNGLPQKREGERGKVEEK